jgi:predicted nucleic acid-binding protein
VAPELFVDTSAWYPIAVQSHPDHEILANALTVMIRDGRRIVTTNLVVAETHALFLSRTRRKAALAFLHAVRQPPNEVVYTTPELEGRAITHWLERYEDQDFSLADAVSFEVMAGRGIRDVLTLDQHFSAAGFATVPSG